MGTEMYIVGGFLVLFMLILFGFGVVGIILHMIMGMMHTIKDVLFDIEDKFFDDGDEIRESLMGDGSMFSNTWNSKSTKMFRTIDGRHSASSPEELFEKIKNDPTYRLSKEDEDRIKDSMQSFMDNFNGDSLLDGEDDDDDDDTPSWK